MEPYEWMVKSTPQTEWIDRRGLLIWLAEVFNGLGGGFYLVSLYRDSLAGMWISWLIIIVLKGGLHFAYLGRPSRFWRMAANPRTSWLSRGFIFLGSFIVLGALQLSSSHWLPGTALETASKIAAGIMVFLVVMNTGFVMNCIHAIPFWNTALLPILFISCGILDGFALTLVTGLLGDNMEMGGAEAGSRLLLIVNAFLITIYLWSAVYTGPTGKQSVMEIIRGRLSAVLWLGVLLCGIVAPFAISIASYFAAEASPPLLITAVVLEMVGAFSLKYTILKSARYSPLIPT